MNICELYVKKIYLFTDGACKGNPGKGGWAALLRYEDHEKEIMGAEELTTNNRMELQAVIEGLKIIKMPCVVEVFTDSQYVQRGMKDWITKWKKNNWQTSDKLPVKNADLWKILDSEALKHTITWHHVKGHTGHIENERVDRLAKQAIDKLLK